MTLRERLGDEIRNALKTGQRTRLDTLRLLQAALIDLEKRGTGKSITPEEETNVLTSGIKKRKESIEFFMRGNRPDLVAKEEAEIQVISEFLPKQMSREEVEAFVASVIAQVGATTAKDFGKVMPIVMKELKGKFDGKIAQEIVKLKLESGGAA